MLVEISAAVLELSRHLLSEDTNMPTAQQLMLLMSVVALATDAPCVD